VSHFITEFRKCFSTLFSTFRAKNGRPFGSEHLNFGIPFLDAFCAKCIKLTHNGEDDLFVCFAS